MSTETPREGEWWWVEEDGNRFPARFIGEECGYPWQVSSWLCRGANRIRPIARMPDPTTPEPEPSEAEKIDRRRAVVVEDWMLRKDGSGASEVALDIRASDEAAGYVLVPLEGPGFEAMAGRIFEELNKLDPTPLQSYGVWEALRAALDIHKSKGEG